MEAVKGYVARIVNPVIAELSALRVKVEAVPEQIMSALGERVITIKQDFESTVESRVKEQAEAVRKLVMADLPEPQPGPPGRDADPNLVIELIKKHVDLAVAEIPPAPAGKDGEPGAAGRDADPEFIRAEVARAVAEIPRPKDGLDGAPGKDGEDGAPGKDGSDGKSVDIDQVRQMLSELVDEAIAKIPKPRDGVDGKDADDDAIFKFIAEQIAKLPPPEKGEKGDPGKDGADGADGLHGDPGRDALDIQVLSKIDEAKVYQRGTFACYRGGLIHASRKTSPITGSLEDAGWQVCMNGVDKEEDVIADGDITRTTSYTDGSKVSRRLRDDDLIAMVRMKTDTWAADFEERAVVAMQAAIDKLPKPKDGKPGADIEDFDIAVQGRRLAIGMVVGGQPITREITLDIPHDAGVYMPGKEYDKSAIVTCEGSAFISQCKTSARPGKSSDWRLLVKRGRDGKDAESL